MYSLKGFIAVVTIIMVILMSVIGCDMVGGEIVREALVEAEAEAVWHGANFICVSQFHSRRRI